jgi:hypothetical protein
VAAKTSEVGTLLTPSLLAQATTLRADLAAVIERSRDLLWWSRQRRRGGAPLGRPIRGATDHVDDAAVVLTTIPASALCLDCITNKSGVPAARVEAILTTIAGTLTLGRAVRSLRRLSRDGTNVPPRLDRGRPAHRGTTRRRVTQHAILRFLGEQTGKAFCADCISTRLFGGKNIDGAMRRLEGNGAVRCHGVCASCGKRRLVAGLPGN